MKSLHRYRISAARATRVWPGRICAVWFVLLAYQASVHAGSPGPVAPELPAPGGGGFRRPVVVDWGDATPTAPPGFVVERFAAGLDHPRWLYVLPNGDVLVAQARTETMGGFPPAVLEELTRQGLLGPSPNTIVLLRPGANGVSRHVLLDNLRQPFGMALLNEWLYVANTDSLVRYPFRPGQTRIDAPAELIAKLPAGENTADWNNHWTRNVVVSPDGSKLYVSVGSATDVDADGNEPPERAAIWKMDPDGNNRRLFATGLRNPTGMDFEPTTGALWTTVNERDGLGNDVPPDYVTEVVDGAFYGWPYAYFGVYPDPTQLKRAPERVAEAVKHARAPDLALGGHSVPLGLLFYKGTAFPAPYRNGAFVARRGGVGSTEQHGYDVVFLPFKDGRPTGEIQPFLTGFIADPAKGTVRGRPVGLALLNDGSLLVSDDAAHVIWRVRPAGKK
jgi:glucose/arabinose dehydrogenase